MASEGESMSSSPQDLPPQVSAFRKWLQRVLVALVIFTIA
jgi:hypothetical protein